MTSSSNDRSTLSLSQIDGDVTQFKNCLSRAGFNLALVQAVNTAEGNAIALAMHAAAVNCLGESSAEKAVEFTSPMAQLAKVRTWNRQFKLGFSEVEFAELERSIPACPSGRLIAVTLVISMDTVETTVKFLWARAAEAQPDSYVWDQIKFGSKNMRLIDHKSFPKALRWEVVDLGANTSRSPDAVLEGTARPRPYAVLASAAMHPLWVLAMDGNTVPYANEASIECTVPGDGPWRRVLGVVFGREARQVRLNAYWRVDAYSDWAVPVPPAV